MALFPSLITSVLVGSALLIYVDASSCSVTFKSNYGELTSPNYPSSYGSNIHCDWMIEGATGSRLVVGFKDFSLEFESVCNNDYIQIRHGNVTTSKYCGSILPDRVLTQSQNATIVFVTNRNTTLRGFHLYWKVFTEPEFMASPVSWESAYSECERNGGKLMEPDPDYLDTYKEIIIEWMGAHNVSEMWVRKYFTPWVFLKGCTHANYVHPQMTYTVKNNQQKICQNLCSGYNYFGLKEGNCVCLNDVVSSIDVVSANASCQFYCQGNTTELCGGENAYTVYKNRNVTANTYGSFECFAVVKNSEGFTGYQMPCSTNLSGIYVRLDSTGIYYNEIAGTWTDVRNYVEQYSLLFPLSTEYEYFYNNNKGKYFWTGLSRNTSTLRPWTAPSECFKLQRRETTLEEKTDTCDRKLPYICQKVPVNCGQSFKQTEGSLNYTIDSGSNDMHCDWKIEGFDNTFIRIDISLNIEECLNCDCDSLKIYDASSAIGPPNKTLCGERQVTFNSTQKALTLTYSSDRSVVGTGFQAQWSFGKTNAMIPYTINIFTQSYRNGLHPKAEGLSRHARIGRVVLKEVNSIMLSLSSQSTTSAPLESTTQARTESEVVSPNTFSAGLIGGIVAAVVVITASVIVLVVVIRRRIPRKKREETNSCATEMVTSNNETESSGDIYSVSAKVKLRKAMDSVEYGVVNKRQTNSPVSSAQNDLIDSGRNSNIVERTSVDDKGHNYLHHGYGRVENVLHEATEDDEYNRLNKIMEPEYAEKSDNVYNHVQGIDNDIYDHTADESETHDRRASYSHVRGPFPSSEHRHYTANNISDVYDHTTYDLETHDRRDLYSHVRGAFTKPK